MISGTVDPRRQPIIQLTVRGSGGREVTTAAIVDTGYNGCLTLPTALIIALALPWRHQGLATLADGSRVVFDVYGATVLWDGSARVVAVDAAEGDILVGMELLDGYVLHVDAVIGGRVTIEALP